jgi:hypothetical protein
MTVDLPDPLEPTSATCRPAGIVRLKFWKMETSGRAAGGVSAYESKFDLNLLYRRQAWADFCPILIGVHLIPPGQLETCVF